MSMTKYERAKVAEFYGDVVADILSSFLSAAEEKEKCRPVLAHRKRLIMMMCFIVYHIELKMSSITKGENKEI